MLFVLLSKRFLLMTVLAGFAFVAIRVNLLDCYRIYYLTTECTLVSGELLTAYHYPATN